MKENLVEFIGAKVISVKGNAKVDKEVLQGKKLDDILTFGKQTYLVFGSVVVRIHLLMFGSYSINEQTKPDKSLRLGLDFVSGSIYFYTCSVKILDKSYLKEIPWEADVLSKKWSLTKTKKKLSHYPDEMVCDILLNQDVFAGVGNIIKNEVLYSIRVHPESKVSNLPAKKINELIREARNYSFDFLEWKRNYVLKKHWLVHTKSVCPKCGEKLIKKHTGKNKRRSFYCNNDQILY